MTYKIIKNSPPLARRGKYPFAEMEVGDAFDTPRDMGKNARGSDMRQQSVANTANYWVKHHNPTAKFRTQLFDADTVRCRREA
jgi:hypothetical protein